MKSSNPHGPLFHSIHFWAYHTGFSPATISRRLMRNNIRIKKRTRNPGVTLREVLWVMSDFQVYP